MLVLLVEDEPLALADIRCLLEAAGHEVLVAADGLEAMAWLGRERTRIDALVTDIKLPHGPDGWLLARRARALSPDILVLYITAATEHEHGLQTVARGRMLEKPFGLERIVAVLAELAAASRAIAGGARAGIASTPHRRRTRHGNFARA